MCQKIHLTVKLSIRSLRCYVLFVYLLSRLSLYLYYKTSSWDWSAITEFDLTYAKLRLAWLAYVDLIDYGDDQSRNFQCPVCGPEPDVIVCDGMTLSLQRRYLIDLPLQTESAVLSGSK